MNDQQANGGQANGGVADAARKVKEDVGALGDAISRKRADIYGTVNGFVREQPLAALGIAFGVGYVLGGGLFTRTTGRLLGLGVRIAGIAMAKNLIGDTELDADSGIGLGTSGTTGTHF